MFCAINIKTMFLYYKYKNNVSDYKYKNNDYKYKNNVS